MLIVTVFAVDVVGHDHIGLIFAQKLCHDLLGLFKAPQIDRLVIVVQALVLQADEHRMVLQPAAPQALHGLLVAGAAAVGHIDDHDVLALRHIVGNRAAKEQQLVVLMGRNNQQINLTLDGLPALNALGNLAFLHDAQLAYARRRIGGRDEYLLRRRIQIIGEVHHFAGIRLGDGVNDVAGRALQRHSERRGRLAPGQRQERRLFVIGHGDGYAVGLAARRPVRPRAAVGQIGLLACGHVDLTVIGHAGDRAQIALNVEILRHDGLRLRGARHGHGQRLFAARQLSEHQIAVEGIEVKRMHVLFIVERFRRAHHGFERTVVLHLDGHADDRVVAGQRTLDGKGGAVFEESRQRQIARRHLERILDDHGLLIHIAAHLDEIRRHIADLAVVFHLEPLFVGIVQHIDSLAGLDAHEDPRLGVRLTAHIDLGLGGDHAHLDLDVLIVGSRLLIGRPGAGCAQENRRQSRRQRSHYIPSFHH